MKLSERATTSDPRTLWVYAETLLNSQLFPHVLLLFYPTSFASIILWCYSIGSLSVTKLLTIEGSYGDLIRYNRISMED